MGGCQVGEYVDYNNQICKPCEAGRYCEDGLERDSTPGTKVSKAGQNLPVTCPPGWECSGNSLTECNAGHYSKTGESNCQEKDFLGQSDMEGFDCPAESYRDAGRLFCSQSELDKTASAPSTNNDCDQAGN